MERHQALINPTTTPAFARDSLQRSGLIFQLPLILADFGCSVDQLDALFPVPDRIWLDPASFITYSQYCGLLDAAVRLTGCPHIGLLLGHRADIGLLFDKAKDRSGLGVAGAWLFSAPTHRDAINGFIALQYSNTRAATVYVHDYGDEAFVGYGILDRTIVGRDQAYSLITVLGVRLGNLLTRGRSSPREVHFPFRPPSNRAPFDQIFNLPIRFNSTGCGAILSKENLDLPLENNNPIKFDDWLARASEIAPPVEFEWTSRVRRILRPLIARNRAVSQVVADICGVSERTLNRRLNAENTSIRELIDEMRLIMAEEYLLFTDLPASEIGLLVGYEEEKSFYRSFKRLTGVAPEQWRTSRI